VASACRVAGGVVYNVTRELATCASRLFWTQTTNLSTELPIPLGNPTLQAIDLAFQCPLAIGFDLAQSVMDSCTPARCPWLTSLRVFIQCWQPAYLEGTACAAVSLDHRVRFVGSLVIRAAFTALPYFRAPKPI